MADLSSPDGALPDHRDARILYNYGQFSLAKAFVFQRWTELALERDHPVPDDLSGACKFGSLFVRAVFGGTIEGHYAHQFNRIGGRIVDLSHDARDVGAMFNPYLHEAGFFDIPEQQASMLACLPRVMRWTEAFMDEHQLAAMPPR